MAPKETIFSAAAKPAWHKRRYERKTISYALLVVGSVAAVVVVEIILLKAGDHTRQTAPAVTASTAVPMPPTIIGPGNPHQRP